ncbi:MULTISPECIES: ABC transporter permease [unclassified Bradyrhizobium]|uniref:ABC transporter permease n=1 Tax=unclassified Bradyrhizobium TaxID=2631580 RepID=UPI0028EA552C|nr:MULTISPECIES: ABC transporter permease [unclassified Bradyrhizobium]
MQKKDLSLLILILVVGAVVAFINPRFLLVGNLSNTANQVGMFGIFSIAEAFVIIVGGIELAVGSVIALLGVLFIDLIVNRDVDWIAALFLILAGGIAIGLVHGTLVTKMRIQPFVVTLCGLLIYRGAARYYTEDATAGFGYGASFPALEWLAAGRTDVLGFPLPHSVVALVIVAGIAWLVLHRSVYGRYFYAVGKNEEAARYSGIRSDRVTIAAYVICGGLTALAAVLLAMYTRSISPAVHGSFYELYAIAAAVLGGCSLRGGEGSVIGVVLGTILLQMLQNLVNLLGIPSSLNFAVMGTVILIGVLADQYFVQRRTRMPTARGQASADRASASLGRVNAE